MRAWFSVPIIKGVRTGISVNPNSFRSSDPLQFVSASGGEIEPAAQQPERPAQ